MADVLQPELRSRGVSKEVMSYDITTRTEIGLKQPWRQGKMPEMDGDVIGFVYACRERRLDQGGGGHHQQRDLYTITDGFPCAVIPLLRAAAFTTVIGNASDGKISEGNEQGNEVGPARSTSMSKKLVVFSYDVSQVMECQCYRPELIDRATSSTGQPETP